MKNAIVMLLIFCLVLFALSCGDDDDSSDDNPANDDDDDDDLPAIASATVGDDDDDNDNDDNDDNDNDDDNDDNDTVTTDPDVPLCLEWEMNPDQLEDPVNITCMIEKGAFAQSGLPEPTELRVVSWNIERGHHIDDMIYEFQNNADLAQVDIILVQEADRHCSRTNYRNVTRELAQALNMDYVYGVEFVELEQARGEHGNAILSRYPITEQHVLRHTDFEKWYEDTDELRLGGRITIQGMIDLGSRTLQVASAHYTSGVAYYFQAHNTQTQETLDMLAGFVGPTVWGGDLNTGLYYLLHFEPSIDLILNTGYQDALFNVPHSESYTHPSDTPLLNARLDWLFFDGLTGQGGQVMSDPPLDNLSDHYGLYADFLLP